MPKRKSFSREFKLEAVRQLELGEKSATTIATELGIRRNMLYKWQEQVKGKGEGAFRGPGRPPIDSSDEIARLKKELAETKMERDILKKAAAYFAKDLP